MHAVRHFLNIAIILTALVVFFLQKRYFPFSDYQMFSVAKKDLTFFTVLLTQKDGTVKPVSNSSISPLSKLHLHQMLAAMSESRSDFYWIKDFFKNENLNANYEKISVVRATYDYKNDRFTLNSVLYETNF